MAIVFKTPDEIAKQYLLHLKGLKPEVNVDQTDSDWWVKAQAIGGLGSGMYADQRKISQDAFPQNARHEALDSHLDLYFGRTFNPPQQAVGSAGVTGTLGSTVDTSVQFLYELLNNAYQATESLTLTEAIGGGLASGEVPVKSVSAGQNQNLLAGAALLISTPPAGVNSAAVAATDFTDGRDGETDAEAAATILERVRFPLAGGTAEDYRQWAKAADPSVVDANIIRFVYGPGTVGIVITAGTTNIDAAVNQGVPVIRQPSQSLIDIVSAYIDAKNPLTDCEYVFAPQSVPIDVTVMVRFKDGDLNTVPATQLSGQTLTQRELIIREVKRAIYKTPPGGRQIGSKGYVLASEIEQVIDFNLSGEAYVDGDIAPILADRQVSDLSASGSDRELLPNQIAEPGTITVTVMS